MNANTWPPQSTIDELCAHCDAPEFTLTGRTVPALVVDCHDADTITAVIELDGGFHKFAIRVQGIDSPEMTDKDPVVKDWAVRARNRMLTLLEAAQSSAGTPGSRFQVEGTYNRKDIKQGLRAAKPVVCLNLGEADKFGRVLADVRYSPDGPTLQETLIREGYCKPYGINGNLTKDVWKADQCVKK